MKKISYASNYFKIYVWEAFAFILRLISMFIVIPYLSKEPAIYGIYSICISLSFFLNYADLGFLKATKKYAAEYYAMGKRKEEMSYLGFGTFILLIFSIVLTIVFLYLGFNPHMVINGLDTQKSISVASELLIILAIFTPVTVLRRLLIMIFNIRLDSFVPKRISIIGSIITISSIFYFFNNDKYLIVQYFLFFKVIDFLVIIISLWIVKRKYNYNLLSLFRNIRFNIDVYRRASRLAYSGLYLMITWVIFYELDKLVIGKIWGGEQAAIYTIALTFPVLFRQIFGIFFTPFVERANHLIGVKDSEGLKRLILKVVIISAPLTVFPTVALAIITKHFILSWVGVGYIESVNLAILLGLSYSFSFITYPTGIILLAKEKIKELYIFGTIPSIVFWLGIIITIYYWGLLSFSLFKLLGMLIIQGFYIFILIKSLGISLVEFTKKVFIPLILPLSFLIISLLFANNFLPYEKSKLNFMINVGVLGLIISISFLIQYYTSNAIRGIIKSQFINIFNKK